MSFVVVILTEFLDEGYELVVKNPGIPYSNPVIKEAIRKEIPSLD